MANFIVNGESVFFPDSMSDEEVQAIVSGQTQQPVEQPIEQPQQVQQPQQALGEGLTFAGGGAETPSALFPRTAEAVGQQKGFLKETGAAGLDLLSLLGRSIASTPELFSDEEKSFVTDLSRTEGTGGFEGTLYH